jgi:hypothetical protein
MNFQLTSTFWLLLNASASAFATHSNYRSSSLQSSSSTSRLPFVYRGGSSSGSALSASVGSPSQLAVSAENLDLLSERGRKTILSIIENDVEGSQSHVYVGWPEAGTQDDDKKRLAEQVRAHESLLTRPTKSHPLNSISVPLKF